MTACRYCGRTEWPYCMNSRDMEDAAIEGVARCFSALEQQGWGEAGERYVRLNVSVKQRARAECDDIAPPRIYLRRPIGLLMCEPKEGAVEYVRADRITALLADAAAKDAEIERLRAALERIERWFGEFPPSERTWDDADVL